jgi:pantetheine-phosphate adenylyltransferase
MRIAVYPGSFDPITLGHLNIIERASRIFDEVIVCVMANSDKHPIFSPEERVEFVRRATGHLPNVKADLHNGLVAEYAKSHGSNVLVKGLRAVSDFENEFQMALINKTINPELETMFLTAESNYTYLSSTVAKEMGRYHVSLDGFIPTEIIADVEKRLDENSRR